jgi:hypothetical protein
MSLNNQAVTEIPALLMIIQTEATMINELLKQGKSAYEVYEKLGNQLDKIFNQITGGSSAEDIFWYENRNWGRYMQLAYSNFDHFNYDALTSYKAGLNVARRQAMQASSASTTEQKDRMLAEAYAIIGFANHFLTDLFSSGHLRTPRRQLFNFAYDDLGRKFAGLCAKAMHDEDNYNGLWVTNDRGDQWVAYGDARYRDDVNRVNRSIIYQAVQASIHDVYNTFITGVLSPEATSLGYIPHLSFDAADRRNYAPLFAYVNNTVVRRGPNYTFVPLEQIELTAIAISSVVGPAPKYAGAPPSQQEVKGPDIPR